MDETWTRLKCIWTSPPPGLKAVNGEVHVWCIHLDMSSMQIQQMEAILSDDELAKAHRFHFDTHRRRYIARHGMLRKVLSKYLYLDPGQIQFNYRPLGKPTLACFKNHTPLCFNLSHSNELALLAITFNRSIGVDIEFKRSNTDLASIAKHYLSPYEYELIKSLSSNHRIDTFFDLWTLKEAYLKATGEGIGGLEKVEFSMSSYDPPQVIINKENTNTSNNWTISQLMPSQGYTAGLAVEGNGDYVYRYYNI
ncbi:MAG: 4'-phosphopantetheinyl transferase superfamily protein [Desulfobacteraceae bacterium]